MSIRETNFIVVPAFARTQLDLKGNELILYSLIYGFSQDGKSEFSGSVKYMCEWLGASKNTVLKSIKGLQEKGLLVKREIDISGVTLNRYTAVVPRFRNCTHGSETAPPRSETAPNNIVNNNNNNNIYIPEVNEVREYVLNNGYSVDAAYFHSYYTAKGWMLGNHPMTDWRAAVDSWETLQYRREA